MSSTHMQEWGVCSAQQTEYVVSTHMQDALAPFWAQHGDVSCLCLHSCAEGNETHSFFLCCSLLCAHFITLCTQAINPKGVPKLTGCSAEAKIKVWECRRLLKCGEALAACRSGNSRVVLSPGRASQRAVCVQRSLQGVGHSRPTAGMIGRAAQEGRDVGVDGGLSVIKQGQQPCN